MDRQLAERMVGAACLLAVLVLVVPSILDGNQEPGSADPEPVSAEVPDLRTHTLTLDSAARVPPVPQLRDTQGEAAGTLPDEQLPAEEVPAPVELQEVAPPAPEPEEKPAVVSPPTPGKAVPDSPAAPATTAVARAAPEAGQWYVQLGSFSSSQNAEGLAKKLKARGFDATIRKSSNGKMSRVLVGPRADRDAAVVLAGKLKAEGFAGQVTRL
ncbi:MAG: SPOR domain-containing protein [Gammaproteobacteria bacterium]